MQRTSWAAGLELVGDDERCVALAGLLPLRLLAERGGLTAGISAAMRRPDHDPDYDRGQVLVDLCLILLAGGQAIRDFQALRHLGTLIGPVASTPTVWRCLNEADGLAVTRIHQAVCRFRRLWWGCWRLPDLSDPCADQAPLVIADPYLRADLSGQLPPERELRPLTDTHGSSATIVLPDATHTRRDGLTTVCGPLVSSDCVVGQRTNGRMAP